MVTKRHNTRFGTRTPNYQVGKSQNLPAGTVVDKGVTSCDLFDFYLIGSQGIQGTSIPTHYRVCHDDNNLHADSAQVFLNNFYRVFTRDATKTSI